MMVTLEKVRLSDVLPESVARDAGVKAAAGAIDPLLQETAGVVDIPSLYVSVWRDTWPIAVKRSVLKTAISDKRMKGTVKAVKQALASVSSVAVIKEWWQMSPKGTPHTFSIVATQSDLAETIDSEMQEDIIALIDDAKPLRSHYNLVIQKNLAGGLEVSGFVRPVMVSHLYPAEAKAVAVETSVGIGAWVRSRVKRHLVFQG